MRQRSSANSPSLQSSKRQWAMLRSTAAHPLRVRVVLSGGKSHYRRLLRAHCPLQPVSLMAVMAHLPKTQSVTVDANY